VADSIHRRIHKVKKSLEEVKAKKIKADLEKDQLLLTLLEEFEIDVPFAKLGKTIEKRISVIEKKKSKLEKSIEDELSELENELNI